MPSLHGNMEAEEVSQQPRKAANIKSLDEIIYPEIEPAIITKQMIEKAYLEYGYKGEAERLHQQQTISYENIHTLSLYRKNILRIDHLWILPNLTKLCLCRNAIEVIENIDMLVNLKELDLSFNYIERIQNIEKLTKIEVLSLFNNRITCIENLDTLENLVILSIGNNRIESLEGIERFRFLEKLKVLNLEGNPMCDKRDFCLRDYIAAVLPNLKYYEYSAIKDEEREKGQEIFARELREIVNNEEMEITERTQQAKLAFDAERLSSSFVEFLNEHQLYESLWKGDDDGRTLMLVGSAADDLAEEYDKDMFEITQEIYKLGLERYGERKEEIDEFMSNMEEGHREMQQMGQKILENFIVFKDKVYEEAYACHSFLEARALRGEDEETDEVIGYVDRLEKITIEFDDTVNNVWQQLMGQELHLHETTEETIVLFQRRMQELMAKFTEQAQAYFGQLRDIAIHFSENLNEIVSRYIGTHLALQDFHNVPAGLRPCLEDREAISNFIAGMKDSHTQRIDEREDRMMQRSREFVENMIDKLNRDELERNRAKVLEINVFLDYVIETLQNIPVEIREELMNVEEGLQL